MRSRRAGDLVSNAPVEGIWRGQKENPALALTKAG